MKYNLLWKAAVSYGPHLTGCEDQLFAPTLKVIHHILQQSQQWFLWKPPCNMSHCPCKGCRRIKKNHLVHSLVVHFMLHRLSLLYLSLLPVGITLQAVPAAPISLVTITVAIMMSQLFCRLSALCGKVAPGKKSLGIQTDTLRPANLLLVNSWCFKPDESLNWCRVSLLQAPLAARVKQLLHRWGHIKLTHQASLLSSN